MKRHRPLAIIAKGDAQDEEQAAIERDIACTDRDIDDLANGLHGLTAEERNLIERAAPR